MCLSSRRRLLLIPWQNYRGRYWNDAYFNALASIEVVAQKHGLTMAEVALRWVSHHSLLKREHGDAVIIGASSLNHIEQVRAKPAQRVSSRDSRNARSWDRIPHHVNLCCEVES